MEDWIIINDKWYHIVIKMNGDIKETYIDGKLFCKSDHIETQKYNTVRYSVSLSHQQIKDIYNRTLTQNKTQNESNIKSKKSKAERDPIRTKVCIKHSKL